MWLNIENNLGKNVTLLTAAGEFRYPDSDKTLKTVCPVRTFSTLLPCTLLGSVLIDSHTLLQLSNLTYGINLMEGAKIRLPYSFHSESVLSLFLDLAPYD